MIDRVNGNEYRGYPQLKTPDAADKTGDGEKFSLAYQRARDDKDEKESGGREKDLAAHAAGRPGESAGQDGVRLELSSQGQRAASMGAAGAKDGAGTEGASQTSGLLSIFRSVREFLGSAWAALKNILYRIWNDVPAEQESGVSGQTAETDVLSEQIAEAVVADEGLETAARNAGTETAIADEGVGTAAAGESMAAAADEELLTPEALREAQISEEKRLDREVRPYLKSGNLSQVINLVTDNGKKTVAIHSTLLTYYDRTGKVVEPNASDRERILHGDRNTRRT